MGDARGIHTPHACFVIRRLTRRPCEFTISAVFARFATAKNLLRAPPSLSRIRVLAHRARTIRSNYHQSFSSVLSFALPRFGRDNLDERDRTSSYSRRTHRTWNINASCFICATDAGEEKCRLTITPFILYYVSSRSTFVCLFASSFFLNCLAPDCLPRRINDDERCLRFVHLLFALPLHSSFILADNLAPILSRDDPPSVSLRFVGWPRTMHRGKHVQMRGNTSDRFSADRRESIYCA